MQIRRSLGDVRTVAALLVLAMLGVGLLRRRTLRD